MLHHSRSSQKTIDREVSHVQSAVNDVEKALKTSNGDVSNLPALMTVIEERLGEKNNNTGGWDQL